MRGPGMAYAPTSRLEAPNKTVYMPNKTNKIDEKKPKIMRKGDNFQLGMDIQYKP